MPRARKRGGGALRYARAGALEEAAWRSWPLRRAHFTATPPPPPRRSPQPACSAPGGSKVGCGHIGADQQQCEVCEKSLKKLAATHIRAMSSAHPIRPGRAWRCPAQGAPAGASCVQLETLAAASPTAPGTPALPHVRGVALGVVCGCLSCAHCHPSALFERLHKLVVRWLERRGGGEIDGWWSQCSNLTGTNRERRQATSLGLCWSAPVLWRRGHKVSPSGEERRAWWVGGCPSSSFPNPDPNLID